MRRGDAALRAIEAAYSIGSDNREWLHTIADALRGLQLGAWLGYTIEGARLDDFVGELPYDAGQIASGARRMPEAVVRAGHTPAPPVCHAKTKWTRVAEAFGISVSEFEALWGYELPRLAAILACDARGDGAVLAVTAERELSARSRRTLAEVGAHVAAAYRLRKRIAHDAEPDAVCSATGRLLDGGSEAIASRQSIAEAVRRMDAARGKLRRLDPDEAIRTWNAMVDGTWTLVDRVDRDGKHLVLAHRNPPRATITALRGKQARVATLAALGHSDKYIGYELGIARTTVSSHLRAALVKLRLRNRRELVAIYGPLARARARPESATR